jgi:hypothetical protein
MFWRDRQYRYQPARLIPRSANDIWSFVAGNLTLVTIPEAPYFVRHDAADLVSCSIRSRLL